MHGSFQNDLLSDVIRFSVACDETDGIWLLNLFGNIVLKKYVKR